MTRWCSRHQGQRRITPTDGVPEDDVRFSHPSSQNYWTARFDYYWQCDIFSGSDEILTTCFKAVGVSVPRLQFDRWRKTVSVIYEPFSMSFQYMRSAIIDVAARARRLRTQVLVEYCGLLSAFGNWTCSPVSTYSVTESFWIAPISRTQDQLSLPHSQIVLLETDVTTWWMPLGEHLNQSFALWLPMSTVCQKSRVE
jgi:hypothetical protein